MGNAVKIGRAFGIDIKVHWTFFLLLAFFAFLGFSRSGSVLEALILMALVIALFICVLMHEYGHSLVAQRLGIDIEDITLLPIGGLARMAAMPEKPMDEVKIAIAGPLVNLVLAPILLVVAFLLGANLLDPAGLTSIGSFTQVVVYLGIINVALAVFNLLPAFPMDGGRILRGLLASRLGAVRATDVASRVGQIFAVGFFLVGLFYNPILSLVAVFIFLGATSEAQMTRQREMMRGLTVADVMGTKRRTETITPYHNFGQVMDAVIHGYQEDFPVVDADGRLVGLITRNEVMTAAHSPDRFASVRDLMRTDYPTLTSDADLFQEGNRILQESGLRAVPVVDDGELAGLLTVEDIGQASLLRDLRSVRKQP